MKLTPALVVCLSLAGNVVLGTLVFKSQSDAQRPRDQTIASTVLAPTDSTPVAVEPSAKTTALWTKLETRDFASADQIRESYDAFKRELRAAGVPENIINAVISSQIMRHADHRRANAQARTKDEVWSVAWNFFGNLDSTTRAEMAATWAEQHATLIAALGDAFIATPDFQRNLKRDFGSVSLEKAVAIQKIKDDYDSMRSSPRSLIGGVTLPEDLDKTALLEKNKRADIAALLTPQELLDYELRNSDLASGLRRDLRAFAPTETEFRAIFALKSEADKNQETSSRTGLVEFDNAQLEKVKTTLGEARYAEFIRAQDFRFQQVTELTERLELPFEKTVAVYDVSKDAEKRATKIRRDKTLTDDAKAQALNQLYDETGTTLTDSLGPRGFAAFKEGGWWMTLTQR